MAIQNFDTFSAIASGFKYLPATLVVQTATVAVGVLADQFTWDTVQNQFFPDKDGCPQGDLKQKVIALAGALPFFFFQAPIMEELQVRGILQDGLLTRAPRAFLGLFGKGHWADAMIAKIGRSVISAGAFSAMHIPNQAMMKLSHNQTNFQLANTFGLGLTAAALKEYTGSIWPAVGLHMLYNGLSIPIPNIYCMLKSSDPASDPAPDTEVAPPKMCKLPEPFAQPFCAAENQELIERADIFERSSEHYSMWSTRYAEHAAEETARAQALRELAESDVFMGE